MPAPFCCLTKHVQQQKAVRGIGDCFDLFRSGKRTAEAVGLPDGFRNLSLKGTADGKNQPGLSGKPLPVIDSGEGIRKKDFMLAKKDEHSGKQEF